MPEISYSRVGEYLLPNIILTTNPPLDGYCKPLGRYARMRRAFLREHRTITYNTLLLTERLYPHLNEVEELASERRARGISEEVILNELVYE